MAMVTLSRTAPIIECHDSSFLLWAQQLEQQQYRLLSQTKAQDENLFKAIKVSR